jgi:hypothetical protein
MLRTKKAECQGAAGLLNMIELQYSLSLLSGLLPWLSHLLPLSLNYRAEARLKNCATNAKLMERSGRTVTYATATSAWNVGKETSPIRKIVAHLGLSRTREVTF